MNYKKESHSSSVSFEGNVEDIFSLYLKDISKYPLLTEEEEYQLALQMRKGDKSVREYFINCNTRLVINIAKQYMNKGVSFEDLVNEGNKGLITAADKYNPDMGTKFSTYATYWIKQAISRGLANNNAPIRTPIHVQDEARHLRGQMDEFVQNNGREPSELEVIEMAKQNGLDEDTVTDILTFNSRKYVYLDSPIGQDEESTYSDIVCDRYETSVVESTSHKDDIQLMLQTLNCLSDRERAVVELTYGLADGKEWPAEEVGKLYGVTRERIRQIKNEALGKLRQACIDIRA